MKRSFALILVTTMLCSMFSGVALAAQIGEIRLAKNSTILSGDSYGTFTVSGSITTPQGGIISKTFEIQVWSGGGALVYSGTATGGQFSFLIETNKLQPVSYTVYAYNIDCDIKPAKFDLLYGVTLTKTLSYTYSTTTQEPISGTIKYAGGAAVVNADVSLYWLDDNGDLNSRISPSGVKTNSQGTFGFIVNGWGGRAGKIALVVNDHIQVVGEVKPMALSVTAQPSSNIVHTVGSSDILLSISGGPTSGTRTLVAKLYKGTVEPSNLIAQGGDTYGFVQVSPLSSTGTATLKLTSYFAKTTMRAGTYTVVVEALIADKKLYEGTATITVINPDRFTLLNSHQLAKFSIGDNTLSVGSSVGSMRIVETDTTGAVIHGENFVYTVYVNGKEAIDTWSGQDIVKRGDGMAKVSVTSLANVAVRVIAHRVVGTQFTQVYDKTFTVPITGWQVSYNVSTLIVDQRSDITVVVKDIDGKSVNNAQVILRYQDASISDRMQSPLISNINNGMYTFKDVVYNKVGNVQIIVATMDYNRNANHSAQLAEVRADFVEGIKIVGAKVYAVTSNVSSLLVGQRQRIILSISDVTGKIVPDALDYYVGGTSQGSPSFSVVDTNNDGLADAIAVEITASDSKPVLIRARNAAGTKMGEVTLSAVAPTLVATGTTNLTADIKTTIRFKVVDPRTNAPLTNTVQFVSGPYIGSVSIRDVEGRSLSGSVYGQSEYTVVVDMLDVDFKQALEDKKTVEVSLKISLDGGAATEVAGAFTVKRPSLTSNPSAYIIGSPGHLTLSYKDANGVPLVGYMIEVNGEEFGKTDAAGQIAYAVAQGSSSTVKFKAHTDRTTVKVELDVAATLDIQPPAITAPAVADGSTAIITITDNVRITRMMINGVEIAVMPLAQIKHVVSLNQGANTFVVIAMDNNYNVTEKTITITRGTVTPPPATGKVLTTVINQRGYTVGGVKVDLAAVEYNDNGDTMMPLRMLDGLGATSTWNEATQTATLTYGNNVVSVTIGVSIALVNGRAVSLIGASGKPAPAYLVPGRTMVPTRFISEQLGLKVEWAPPNNLVITAP